MAQTSVMLKVLQSHSAHLLVWPMTILICILYGVACLIGFLGLITWATHFSRKDVDQHRRDLGLMD